MTAFALPLPNNDRCIRKDVPIIILFSFQEGLEHDVPKLCFGIKQSGGLFYSRPNKRKLVRIQSPSTPATKKLIAMRWAFLNDAALTG